MSDKTDDGRFGMVGTFRVYFPAFGGGMTTKKGGIKNFLGLKFGGLRNLRYLCGGKFDR